MKYNIYESVIIVKKYLWTFKIFKDIFKFCDIHKKI